MPRRSPRNEDGDEVVSVYVARIIPVSLYAWNTLTFDIL